MNSQEFQDVRVLVTGGSGFVGGRLAARLAARGAEVIAIVRRRGEHEGLASPNIEQLEGCFDGPDTARRACEGVDFVVHAAAAIGGSLDEARRVNALGTATLAAAARAAGCRRFLHISTISVYDWEAGLAVFDESAPLKTVEKPYPHSPAASPFYGLSKAEAERALAVEAERGLAVTVFRLGAVFGLHPTSSWSVLVPAKLRDGRLGPQGDGSGALPWCHIENIADALELALVNPVAVGKSYNLVDGHATMRDYFGEIERWFPEAPRVLATSQEAKPNFATLCSTESIRADLGYVPRRTFADAMAEAAAGWRLPSSRPLDDDRNKPQES